MYSLETEFLHCPFQFIKSRFTAKRGDRDKSGEAVKLFVVRTDAGLTEQDVKDWCAEGLTNYKRPKYVEFRDELPKTNVGKILRRELREE